MQTTYYHGTAQTFSDLACGDGRHTTGIDDQNIRAGVFLTTERADADFYAQRAAQGTGEEARVLTCTLADGCQLLDYEEVGDDFADTDRALVQYALENGFGGVHFPRGGDVNTPGTVLVFDPSHITIQ